MTTGSAIFQPWELDEKTVVRFVKESHVDLVAEFDLVSTTQSTMTPATTTLATAPGPVGSPFSPDAGPGGGGQPWGFAVVRQPGRVTEDTDVMAEIKVFSVPAGKLVWSGVSRTFHARGDADVGDSLSVALLKDLSRAGILPD